MHLLLLLSAVVWNTTQEDNSSAAEVLPMSARACVIELERAQMMPRPDMRARFCIVHHH